MKEYKNFPPYYNFIQVLDVAPSSLKAYIKLWQMRDDKNKVVINKKEVRNHFLISPTLLRNKMLELVGQGIISVGESPSNFVVNLNETKTIEIQT